MKNNKDCHVLCVEDEKDVGAYIEEQLVGATARVKITFAESRDEAFEILEAGAFFDYVTLDLTIPSVNGSFEKNPSNGLAVLGKVKELSPGTPVLVLSGTSTVEMISEFLNNSHNVDIWSEGISRSTICHLTKDNLKDLHLHVHPVISAIASLSDVELDSPTGVMRIEDDRLVRIFAKKKGASFVQVSPIGGGYSSARVYSLVLRDHNGLVTHRAVAKCGNHDDIDKDALNYEDKISRLKPEATPRKVGHLRFGAQKTTAVFYQLISDYDCSFFTACFDEKITSGIVGSLAEILRNWHEASVQERKSVRDIRRFLLSDEKSEKIVEQFSISDALEFENKYVQSRMSCVHGDLHGENVLVNSVQEVATLIDYGDVSEGSSILDPLTLECSFLFHSKAPSYNWPKVNDIENWVNLDAYTADCPYPETLKMCRAWLNRLKVGNRELAACLYAYSMRQLGYEDTNKDLALGLVKVAFDLYESS